MRRTRIDLNKVPDSAIFHGKNGARYLTVVEMENKDGKDQFDNDGFVVIDVTKEEREAGRRGPIVGNFKDLGGKPPARSAPATRETYGKSAEYPRVPKPTPKAPVDPDLDAADGDSIPF